NKRRKMNLLVFITPHVISDPDDMRRIWERKMREREEFITRYAAPHDERDVKPPRDYHHQHGLLEDINRTTRAMLAEKQRMDEIRSEEARRTGAGPVVMAPAIP